MKVLLLAAIAFISNAALVSQVDEEWDGFPMGNYTALCAAQISTKAADNNLCLTSDESDVMACSSPDDPEVSVFDYETCQCPSMKGQPSSYNLTIGEPIEINFSVTQ